MDTQDILERLNWRYAVKRFDPDRKLTSDQVHLLQESLRLAPSSFGLQPWYFYFLQTPELRKRARELAWNQSQVEDASQFIVLCRPELLDPSSIDHFMESIVSRRGVTRQSLAGYEEMLRGFVAKYTPEQLAAWMDRQVYVALGTLLTVCAMAGIDACPMEGFEPDAMDRLLGLGERKQKSVVCCAVGYRSEEDKYSVLPKVRYDVSNVMATL